MRNLLDLIRHHNPAQSHWELEQLCRELRSHVEPGGRVLEVGTHRGGTARVFRDWLSAHVICVNDVDELDARYDNSRLELIVGRSQEPATLLRVIDALGKSERADFLFIDGGHAFEDVAVDYALYSPLLRPGGIVAFHDVVVADNPACQVWRYWQDHRRGRHTKTLWDGTDAGTGIGVIYP